MKLLTGKIVYIFGASGGIGFQIAKKVALEEGKLVLFCRDIKKLKKLMSKNKLLAELILTCDVANKKHTYKQINKAIQITKKVDLVFYCIGIGQQEAILEHRDTVWDKTIDINLNAAYRIIKSVIPSMIQNKYGRIVIISSRFGKMGASGLVAYSASKHGLAGLVKSTALELAKYNITVNAVCPGRVETNLTSKTAQILSTRLKKSKNYILKKFNQENAIKRLITPDEVADLSLFLGSNKAGAITGELFGITGGLSSIYE